MKRLLLVPMLAVVVTAQTRLKAPPGYRFPIKTDYSGNWATFRARMPVPFHVMADFNGDGHSDEAWLLPAVSGQAWALFVFLKTSTGPYQVVRLEGDSQGPIQRFGIARVEPGRYDTACGKGHLECKADEPEVLELRLPWFEFFVFEERKLDLLVGHRVRQVQTHVDQ